MTKYAKLNREKINAIARNNPKKKERAKYYNGLRDREEKRAYDRQWIKNHKEFNCAKASKNRAHKLNATPVWANKDKIALVFIKAKFMEWFTGEKYHVDHIIPLKHDLVCGLHVENNLQVVPQNINLSKNNRFEVI